MADRDNGDRGALIALGMALIAVVVVIWLEQPSLSFAFAGEGESLQGASVSDVDRVVAALKDHNPWEDSFAQWAMAGISAVGTVVSIWAVILLRATLRATREAVRSSDDAVKAAEASVMASERFGKIQSRAYVSVSNIKTDPDQSIGFSEGKFAAVVLVRNFGSTPAYECKSKVCLIESGRRPSFPDLNNIASKILGPGAEVGTITPDIWVSDFFDPDSDDLKFVLYYSYRDIFEIEYRGWSLFSCRSRNKRPDFVHIESFEEKIQNL